MRLSQRLVGVGPHWQIIKPDEGVFSSAWHGPMPLVLGTGHTQGGGAAGYWRKPGTGRIEGRFLAGNTALSTQYSCLLVATVKPTVSSATSSQIFSICRASDNTRLISLGSGDGTNTRFRTHVGGAGTLDASADWTLGDTYSLVIRLHKPSIGTAGDIDGYVNGQQLFSGATVVPSAGFNNFEKINLDASNAASTEVYLAGAFFGLTTNSSISGLPQSFLEDLSADMSLLYRPKRVGVPVSGGGGGSWSVSLTESASASDSLGAATTALVSLIESASAADIITAATIAAVALTEAASASDTQTAGYSATGSGSVTESASASDALTAANIMLRALTETASADDQLAAATTMLRAISESASAVDTPAASYTGAGAAAITETASASDALTAAATLLVTILEAGSADDALQAATTMVRLITESAAATASVSAASPTVADVSITELAAAVDAIVAYVAGDLDALARYTITGRARSLALVGRLRKLELPQ